MRRRKLVITVAAAAIFGVLSVPASAELHRVTVTLITGQKVTLTVDVPPGTPVESIQIPGLPAPVQSIRDLGPVGTATPSPTATATPAEPAPTETPSQTATPAPTEPPAGKDDDAPARGNKGGRTRRMQAQQPDRLDPNAEALTGELEEQAEAAEPEVDRRNPTRNTDGSPTLDNPTVSLAEPGPARIGVPNFFIEKFRIPPFLLPIYQAAGIEYGVRWEVLAAINEIETDYGRNLNVSSAGALGWMQFMPSTWETYGVDGNQDGLKDPYNPVDAIFAAARYLRAAGADTDLRTAIFAYNHADWYVDSVILRARYIGGLPADLVGSLSGLTQGRFPVQAKATYAKEVRRKDLETDAGQNPAYVVESSSNRKGIKIFAKPGAPVVAVNDGRIVRTGHSRRLGNFVTLQDVYGNTYTYGHLKSVVERYPTPKPQRVDPKEVKRELQLPSRDAAPRKPASETTEAEAKARRRARAAKVPTSKERRGTVAQKAAKERLFANPDRPNAAAAGGEAQADELSEGFGSYLNRVFGLDRADVVMKPLKRGARVTSGTVLGRVGRISARNAPHLLFEIRPAGRGAPRIDPKPILDGWKLLESTAIYRAAGRNPFVGKDAQTPSIGQILLMSKESLAQRVLADPNVADLRVRALGHPQRPDRPARAGDARVPRRLRPQADGHVAALRPLLPDRVRQRLRALDRHRGRHRRDQRRADPRPPGRGLDRRADRPAAADPAGHDEAPPDHLADEVPGHRQHARDGGPRRPHPRRLPPALRGERGHGQAGRRDPQARAVDQADRAARRDRQPQGPAQPVEVRGQDGQARQPGPQGRVARPAYFGFVQWELPGRQGPDPGRYVVRRYAGDEAQQVVVIGGLAAPRRAAPPCPPRRGRGGAGGGDARDGGRRRAARGRGGRGGVAGARGWATRRWRATPWPCSTPRCTPGGSPRPTRSRARSRARHALVTRVGYGTGEEVAEGRWTAARELPPERAGMRREAALRPQERFAALLAGRDVALAAELLALRARLDLDHGRAREAALQLDAALGAALGELEGWRELDGMPERLDELRGARARRGRRPPRPRAAGALEAEAAAAVAHALAPARGRAARPHRERRVLTAAF